MFHGVDPQHMLEAVLREHGEVRERARRDAEGRRLMSRLSGRRNAASFRGWVGGKRET